MFDCWLVATCHACRRPLFRLERVSLGTWLVVMLLTRVLGWELGFGLEEGRREVEVFARVSGRTTHWVGPHADCESVEDVT